MTAEPAREQKESVMMAGIAVFRVEENQPRNLPKDLFDSVWDKNEYESDGWHVVGFLYECRNVSSGLAKASVTTEETQRRIGECRLVVDWRF